VINPGKLVRKYLFLFHQLKSVSRKKNILDTKLINFSMFLVSSSSLKVILENKVVCFKNYLHLETFAIFFPFRKVPVLYPKLTEVAEFFCSDFRVLWNRSLVHSDFCQAKGSELTSTFLC